jgi:lactoylglutathione lyase
MLKFSYTILYVKDVTKTIVFYEKAFGFKKKFIAPNNEYGELDTGSTTLSFAKISLAKKNLPKGFIESSIKKKPFAIELGFTTDNVEKAVKTAVKAGAKIAIKPAPKAWGQIVGYVRDPNGFLIEICTPMN